MFLMSRIGVLNANRRCIVTESSINGMYLKGHVFKMYRDQLPRECYFRREEEVTCQSYNVIIGQNICELNNRTKEARPEDFMPNFLHFRLWANLFFLIFHSRLQKTQRNKTYIFGYIPMASLLMIQFRGLFQYW